MAKKPHFSRFSALREAAAGWRRAEPRQAGRLAAVGKFFAAMLVLTLAARGLAGASMPVVTLTGATSGNITQTRTVAGSLSVQGGAPLTLPEGLLVTEVCANAGEEVAAGAVIARFDAAGLAQAIAEAEANVQQLRTTVAQLRDPETADDFALQQAQQQLDRAYAESEATWQAGEEAVAEARDARDSAQNALNALRAATPESADTAQAIAEAEAALAAAEQALQAAEESAEAANKAATSSAQNYEDARNSAAHSFAEAAKDAAKTTASNSAQAGVTAAQLAAAEATLAELRALQQAGGALTAPAAGTLTELNLTPGQQSPRVAGLLADGEVGSTLVFTLDESAAKLATVGTAVTVRQGSAEGQAAITALGAADDDGSVQATAALDGRWKAGAATVELKLNAGQFSQCLPATAVQYDSSGDFVYLIESRSTLLGQQNALVRLPVTVLAQGDGTVAVDAALSGQVVAGADKPLAAGAWVRVAG